MVARRTKLVLLWHRSGLLFRAILMLLVTGAFGLLLYSQWDQEDASNAGSNLLFLLLINLTITVIGILVFLVGRNVLKLFFERRHGILGSKLRVKLVVAFVGLTLIPAVIQFVMSSGFLTAAMEGWFSRQIEDTVESAIEVGQNHYASLEQAAVRFSAGLARELELHPELVNQPTTLSTLLEQRREDFGFFSIRILTDNFTQHVEVSHPGGDLDDFREPDLKHDFLERALRGEPVVTFEELGGGQFIRAYSRLRMAGAWYVLVTATRINPELSYSLATLVDSFEDYKKLAFSEQPLKSTYILTLGMITGLILFAALWVAFYISRELVVPIQRLARGTQEVAKGNYGIQIRGGGNDEFGLLISDFNTMTADLRRTSSELENRRLYLETILTNLAVGVIAFDHQERVTLVNATAREILGLENTTADHTELLQVIGEDLYKEVTPLLRGSLQGAKLGTTKSSGRAEEGRSASVETHDFRLMRADEEHRIVCTLGVMTNVDGQKVGSVLLFDDVTEISKAQHLLAWRDVARRVAHEIKNPLTPIRLSAQRLLRTRDDQTDRRKIIEESGQTILENVDSIKRLVDEFSRLGTMPTAEFGAADLNTLISETISPFASGEIAASIQFIADSELPFVWMDREQMRRLCINLVDNALASVTRAIARDPHVRGRIVVRTQFEKEKGTVILEVSDNGPGIPRAERGRIFEPYYTTKEGGTGLGLAIVQTIVEAHQGQIRVLDNQPTGIKMQVEFPVERQHSIHRKFG
jgi:two-component system nitrogen regulation sensor histidine kinase NtrY